MSKLEALLKDELGLAQATPGITRHVAFQDDGVLVLRARSEPGVVSGWHHHGEHDVYGYLVSGQGRFERADDPSQSITVQAGDFFHVPAHTVHREINPSAGQPNEMVLFLRGGGPLVVNVDHDHSPDAD